MSYNMSSLNATVDPSDIPLLPGSPIFNALYQDYSSSLIGSWITMLLCGVALAQAYNYFNSYTKDSAKTKLLVFALSLLNVLHTAFVCIAEYTYLISDSGDRTLSLTIGWAIVVTVEIHIIIAVVVLLYLTHMCFQLLAGKKSRKPLVVVLFAVIFLHFGFGTATVVELSRLNTLYNFDSFKNTVTVPMVTTQVVADVSVAISVCYSLPRPSKDSFRRSREVVQTLVAYAVSRGILTSLMAIIELIGLTAGSGGLWFAAADYVIAGLYVNSFLATLNSRNKIRQKMEGVVNVDLAFPHPLVAQVESSSDGDSLARANVGVHILISESKAEYASA